MFDVFSTNHDPELVERIVDRLCEAHWKYPGMRLDHDGYYEVTYIVLDAIKAYSFAATGKP